MSGDSKKHPIQKSASTDEEGQGELYSANHAVKIHSNNHQGHEDTESGVSGKGRGKRKETTGSTDEAGQGELYSPDYAVKVNSKQEKKNHQTKSPSKL
ncbi:hypothetical protein LIER_39803 [Lithospermum erythrorhizon]|uniref:Uncharacterized protein n=1 Tax=Lithospermum erythrorhizon TaxID=34254 RepID=A0AAV3QLU6_LITER